MRNWLKEPLLHFLVIGTLLFVVFAVFNKQENAVDIKKIVVSAGDMERLAANWSKKWNRQPTEAELKGLIDSYIKEEVYYREALALGLDQDDTVLRRRLMQKMEFLSNDLADLNNPDETALNEYFLANSDKYELPARISFTHIYFSLDKHGNEIFDNAGKALAYLQAASTPITHAPELARRVFEQRYPSVADVSTPAAPMNATLSVCGAVSRCCSASSSRKSFFRLQQVLGRAP